jgi:hypothetical protein
MGRRLVERRKTAGTGLFALLQTLFDQHNMKRQNSRPKTARPLRAKCVVVVYENPAVREHAARFCDHLSERHRAEARLEITWWSFAFIEQPVMAHDAGRRAADAELIVFALEPDGDLPQSIKVWIDGWIGKRCEHEGAIIGLTEHTRPGDIASLKEIYLRHVAHRAGLDYLSHASPTVPRAIPDSIDSFRARAGQMTSVLDEILRAPSLPPPLL